MHMDSESERCGCGRFPSTQVKAVVEASRLVMPMCWMKAAHTLGNTRGGTTIQLDVNSGVFTVDVWVGVDENRFSFQLAGDDEWQSVRHQ